MPFEPHDWLKRIERAIWGPQRAGLPVTRKLAVRVVRLVVILVRDVVQGELTLWTMSLVYTTLLSMVPLLALSFSVLKAFGVHNQVEPLLDNLLAPLGAQGQEVSSRIVGFIEHMNVGVLGAVGLAMLIYTVISLMQKIEESFNAIWHVTQLRSLAERFTRYLSALLIGPLLVFAALGLTAAALSSRIPQAILAVEPLGTLVFTAGKLVPYALVIGAFTFFYLFVPNTRVRFVPAFVAGIVGGVLWQTAGWAFAAFVVSSTRYAAIYSSFAILVFFLIWLYVSWLVLLIGAAVSFYVQHPEYLYASPGEPRLSNRMRERLALAIMDLIGSHFVRGQAPWTLHRLTRRLAIPMHSVNVVLEALAAGGLVRQSNDDPPAYLPSRDLSRVSIAEVLAMVRKADEDAFVNPDSLPLAGHVAAIVDAVDDAITRSTAQVSVRDMVERSDGTAPVDRDLPARSDEHWARATVPP
ncbi:MAG: YihY/virulence factor BrkB family protein [Rudaea sp.]